MAYPRQDYCTQLQQLFLEELLLLGPLTFSVSSLKILEAFG
jgi:hypothetical protein